MAIYTRQLTRALARIEALSRPATDTEAEAVHEFIRRQSSSHRFNIPAVNGLLQYFNDEALLIGTTKSRPGAEAAKAAQPPSLGSSSSGDGDGDGGGSSSSSSSSSNKKFLGDLDGDGAYSLGDLKVLIDGFGEMEARAKEAALGMATMGRESPDGLEHAAAAGQVEALAKAAGFTRLPRSRWRDYAVGGGDGVLRPPLHSDVSAAAAAAAACCPLTRRSERANERCRWWW